MSTCVTCDGPLFKGKTVAVIGGGDAAMEEALVLTKYATDVTLIHRRDQFKASAIMQKKVYENPKVKILWNTEVTEVVGNGKLEKLKLKNNQTGKISEIPFDGAFIAIGHKPESDLFKGPLQVDEKGYIKINDHTKTSIPNVFVAGDVHDAHYKQAITAAGFGCMAGMDAVKFLDEMKLSS